MSLITINSNITNVLPVFGEGNVSYTCPQDKRAFVTVTMILSFTRYLYDSEFGTVTGITDFKNRTYTFDLEIKGGDVLTFFETGEAFTTASLTLNTSFVINGTTTIAKTLAATQSGGSSIRYAANISYSAIEYPA